MLALGVQSMNSVILGCILLCLSGSAQANPWNRPSGSSFGIPGRNATFDYIIIGGGTAGLTVATRLAEQQDGRVAVIEAGSFYEISNGNLSQIPAFVGSYTSKNRNDWHPLIDWGYVTSPQKSAHNTEMHLTRGKTLGGSSARNFMAYQRGTKSSYQMWADMVGDQSYTFDQLMPFFTKSINFTEPNPQLRFANSTPEYDAEVLGNGSGPLRVSYPNYANGFGSWVAKGLQALGMSVIPGFESGALLGHSYTLFTLNPVTATRESSETSFLRKALRYPNYSVYTLTMAKRIIFDADNRATGVVVDTLGAQYVLQATKEVILSAGAIGSPQLLMASGIGPSSTLHPLGIKVTADRPGVGQNLQDHVSFGASYRVNVQTASSFLNPKLAAEAVSLYQNHAAGIYANPGSDVLGWEKLPEASRESLSTRTKEILSKYPEDWPELEYLSMNSYRGYQNVSGGSDPNDGFNYATLGAALCAPRSRGNVTIVSADTAIHPIINPNYFDDRADIEVAIAGYKRLRKFWKSDVVQQLVIGEEVFPGLQVSTDAQLEDLIKKSFQTVSHASCTCAMGRENDSMAVVDTQGKVYGVKGLRIIDASIFPMLPPGHPMATVYAIAEKLACSITGQC